jgi:hypothetical protein
MRGMKFWIKSFAESAAFNVLDEPAPPNSQADFSEIQFRQSRSADSMNIPSRVTSLCTRHTPRALRARFLCNTFMTGVAAHHVPGPTESARPNVWKSAGDKQGL